MSDREGSSMKEHRSLAPAAAKVGTADKAREQAHHVLQKGQSTLGSLFH